MKTPIRICMVGAGRVGKNHSRALTRVPGARIVALVDPFAPVRDETAAEFGIEACFETLEMALETVEFDAVVITTPTPTHLPLSALAAENKKHVFLEKPMALNLEECDAIIKVTEQNGVILQLGFMRRFDPEFVAAAQRIEAGEIG
ncbi:MAG TPA: Gfo/Idh/MocA family oxidoreductase, partial [Anaerolineales bacterium]|nr:Gfo/Idh/MocA family oxidoreductase [Anaerolineales bacterium]